MRTLNLSEKKVRLMKGSKKIKVDYLARVEGEGSLYVRIKDDQVVDAKFKIFEPPRFFEAFLRGRKFSEAPDITARICGICPIAYQMSSVHAMESVFGVRVEGALRELRRLIYCGEWIESHVLHVAMLHAPDFLGYQDSIQMAQDFPEQVQMALKIKKIGNSIVALLGGREIHPINVRVGGFYRVPSKKELLALKEPLEWALEASIALTRWVASLDFPDFEQDYEYVALSHPDEYPFNEGRLVSNKGLDISVKEYEEYFEEEHVPYSNALHSVLKGRGSYLVGPLARFNLNFEKLSPEAQKVARDVGFEPVCGNQFKSIIARSVETVFAVEEALRIISSYEEPEAPAVDLPIRAGTGYGCTEAPRGILYHRYRVDDKGIIQSAKIVPPTSQNQKTIEQDLWHFVAQNIDLDRETLQWKCEQAIRNYDPCISCATHFLNLKIERE